MGRIIKINRIGNDWFAANWAAEHLVGLILRFLSPNASETLRTQLAEFETMPLDLSLTDHSVSDMRHLLHAAECAFDALTKAGPESEYFGDPSFYSAFVDRFREFIDLVREDERLKTSAA
jgi:hypothetical protein